MQAKELKINDIQDKEYFCVVYKYKHEYPQDTIEIWEITNRLFIDEISADLYIKEQKQFYGNPGYGKKEYKKFSIILPI